jgi:hypothetical protein
MNWWDMCVGCGEPIHEGRCNREPVEAKGVTSIGPSVPMTRAMFDELAELSRLNHEALRSLVDLLDARHAD